jgi:hypothetical protein
VVVSYETPQTALAVRGKFTGSGTIDRTLLIERCSSMAYGAQNIRSAIFSLLVPIMGLANASPIFEIPYQS